MKIKTKPITKTLTILFPVKNYIKSKLAKLHAFISKFKIINAF